MSVFFSVNSLMPTLLGWRAAGQTVALANGCFDCLHKGHVKLLVAASSQANRLIVAVDSDRSVKMLKGPHRPIMPESHRCGLLADLRFVDAVLRFDVWEFAEIAERIAPDVLVRGDIYGGWAGFVGAEFAGRVHLVPLEPGHSTTAIVEAIRRQPENSAGVR